MQFSICLTIIFVLKRLEIVGLVLWNFHRKSGLSFMHNYNGYNGWHGLKSHLSSGGFGKTLAKCRGCLETHIHICVHMYND